MNKLFAKLKRKTNSEPSDVPGSFAHPIEIKVDDLRKMSDYAFHTFEEDLLKKIAKDAEDETVRTKLNCLGWYQRYFTTMSIRKTFEKESLTCFRCHTTNIPRKVHDSDGNEIDIKFCPMCNAMVVDFLG